jgi:hypothetical protein
MAYMNYNWDLVSNLCFVFGSNLAGYHSAGAAYYAHQGLGAAWGVGTGRTGRCYAIPTKDGSMQTLSLDKIENFVYRFIKYAEARPGLLFVITPIGCGLAGHNREDIMQLIIDQGGPLPNMVFTASWVDLDVI